MKFDLSTVQDIILHHVGRVMRSTSSRFAVRRDDLMQDGRVGAWYAFRSFKPNGGMQWRNWAGIWIRAYVERGAWGAVHSRGGANAEGRRNAVSLDCGLTTNDGETRTVADVIPDPRPSPEQRAIDRQALDSVLRVLLAKRGDRSRFNVSRAVRAVVAGEQLRTVARREGVSFQAVDQNVRARLAKARAVREAA